MPTDSADPRPPYRQVADQLRDAIYAGRLRPGDRLPSQRELAEEYGITQVTARQAIGVLKAEGLVDAMAGRGVFVRQRRPWIHISPAYLIRKPGQKRGSWKTEAERQGRTPHQDLLAVEIVTPPPDIAAILGLEENNNQVLVRRRLLFVDNEPVQLVDSYFPYNLVQSTPIAEPTKIARGVRTVLEEDLGIRTGHFIENITVRMPTPNEARQLRLQTGIPILRLLRTTYSSGSDGKPIHVEDCVLAGDRHVLTYEFPGELG